MRRGLLALGLLLCAGAATSFSTASFSASSVNPSNGVTTASVGAASALTATTSGANVQVGWTAGTNASSYVVSGGTSATSACTGVTYAQLATPSAVAYTDTGRSTPAGTWYCYSVQSVFHSFSSVAASPVAAAQLGMVASAATLTNAADPTGCSGLSGAGYLDCGDRIVIDFNQAVDTTLAPSSGKVCAQDNASVILIGYTGAGTCATTGYSIGKLSGVSTTSSARWDATFTWSNANKRLTILLGTRRAGASNTRLGSSGSWTSTPASGGTSAVGAVALCTSNSGGANCLPTATGSL